MAGFAGGGTSLYQDYLDDLMGMCDTIAKKLQSGEKVDALLKECERIAKQCTIESRKLPGDQRSRASAEIKSVKAKIDSLKRQSVLGSRSGHVARGNTDTKMTAAQARERTAATQATMARSSQRLKEAQAALAETEEIAMGTMSELARNRVTIERNVERNNKITSDLDKADGLARSLIFMVLFLKCVRRVI